MVPPSVEARGSVLRRARSRTDQGMPKPEASDLTNPGVRMAARGPVLALAEASPSWRQGGATLGLFLTQEA
jgi:hypothetical protein